MVTLKIPKVILRERRGKKLTQEELASALNVTPQAISNWERGGYPDITLLPRIANFFGITVDELIGNDEVTHEEDIENFKNKYWDICSSKAGYTERSALAKEYYQKYPHDYDIMWHLGNAIIGNIDDIEENQMLLREIYEKILSGCTYEPYRRAATDWICYVCPDDELDDCIVGTGRDWGLDAVSIGMLKEERLQVQERWNEFRSQRDKNDLLLLMQYLGRNNMMYYGSDVMYHGANAERRKEVFDEPEHTVEWESHKIKLLSTIDDNGLPDAWLGCYAESHLKLAGALMGCGRIDEGFAALDEAFALYEKWNAIPDKGTLSFGTGIYGDANIAKNGDTVYYKNGSSLWTPYLWLFWQHKNDIYQALIGWPWFENVKDDERYQNAIGRSKNIAEIK